MIAIDETPDDPLTGNTLRTCSSQNADSCAFDITVGSRVRIVAEAHGWLLEWQCPGATSTSESGHSAAVCNYPVWSAGTKSMSAVAARVL